MLREIRLTNLLSFGPDTPPLELRPLNVLIGPNGSGKSNLIEAISLLQAAPSELAAPIREGGGIREWLWKGQAELTATVAVVSELADFPPPLLHTFSFCETGQRFELTDECIQSYDLRSKTSTDKLCVQLKDVRAKLEAQKQLRNGTPFVRRSDRDNSMLATFLEAQMNNRGSLLMLQDHYRATRIYREWSFGRSAMPRLPQPADQRNDFLAEDLSNLGLVLNRLRRDPAAKSRLMEALREVYAEVTDFDVSIQGGTVQVVLEEGKFSIPASRLSDGTLRYLCLLAVLCEPTLPPLACLEEPELGLHPDVLPSVAELIKEASQRSQLIVTTHSDVLVDALSSTPEDIVVCEKQDGATQMRRLDGSSLAEWLTEYGLGQLWRRGQIGGNRW